jgi:hypothetical protein
MEVRRQWKILLQLQFEGLGTQIGWSNETFRNTLNMKCQVGQAGAVDVSLGLSETGSFETSQGSDPGVHCTRPCSINPPR